MADRYREDRYKAIERAQAFIAQNSSSTDLYTRKQLEVVHLFTEWTQGNWTSFAERAYLEFCQEGMAVIILHISSAHTQETERQEVRIPVSVQVLLEALFPEHDAGLFFEWFWYTLQTQIAVYGSAASPESRPPETKLH